MKKVSLYKFERNKSVYEMRLKKISFGTIAKEMGVTPERARRVEDDYKNRFIRNQI